MSKIDIYAQPELSDQQLNDAYHVWKAMKVFDTPSDVAIDNVNRGQEPNLQEERIWAATFTNYSSFNERDVTRLKRFTNDIMKKAREIHMDFSIVDRENHRINGESFNVIAKMERNAALRKYNRSLGSSATNFIKADKLQEDIIKSGITAMEDLLGKMDARLPNLMDRRELYRKIAQAAVKKDNDTQRMIENMNGGIAGVIGDAVPPPEVEEQLKRMEEEVIEIKKEASVDEEIVF